MESPLTRSVFHQFFEYLLAPLSDAHIADEPSSHNSSAEVSAEVLLDAASSFLVLTPNDRLATRLKHTFDEWVQQGDITAWSSPTFISLARWTQDQWRLNKYHLSPDHPWGGCYELLEQDAETVLWSEVLEHQAAELNLLDHKGLVAQAQSAYRISRAWQMSDRELDAHAEGDQLHYVHWQAAFVTLCRQLAVLPKADLLDVLSQIEPSTWRLGLSRCCWLGFSELTPVEQHLFDRMPSLWQVSPERLSLRQFVPKSQHFLDQTFVYKATDEADQNHQAIRWLASQANSNAQMALVVPDLPTRRNALEIAFRDIWGHCLSPQALLELPDANLPKSYLSRWANFSGGGNLSQQPMYYVIVALLEMSLGEVSVQHIEILLLSPYVSHHEDTFFHRSRLVGQFKELQADRWSLTEAVTAWQLLSIKPLNALAQCPHWIKAMELTVARFNEPLTAENLIEVLSFWGWPGDRTLDSVEYQQMSGWPQLLARWQQIAQLRARINPSMDAHHRRAQDLLMLLENQLFQPQSSDTSLQVLGILEALEQPFDALWFMGAHDEALPAPARPHPLLPLSLQRHYQSLRATPARELALAQEVVSAFSLLSAKTCFSWPEKSGAKIWAPSPLVTSFPSLPPIEAPGPLFEVKPLNQQCIPDESPALENLENLKGGAGILNAFAQCPFRAFALYRLKLPSLFKQPLGLSALDRGSLVHAVLEAIWLELKDQAGLLALNTSERSQLVRQHVDHFVEKLDLSEGVFLGEMIFPVEKLRLERLVDHWLKLETKRAPFKVKALEHSLNIELESLPLNLRLDRIDELDDGQLIVIDYKTGLSQVGQWFGKRIQSPQLPLYSIALSPMPQGLVFAQVRAKQLQFKGVVAEGVSLMAEAKLERSIFPIPEFTQQVNQWSDTLKQMALNFQRGHAEVDPIEGEKTCEFCEFSALCRIKSEVA